MIRSGSRRFGRCGWILPVISTLGLVMVQPSMARSAADSPSPTMVNQNPRPAQVVYLTFDDGPHPVNTPRILEVLAKHGARGTFFVVGSMVRQWPDAARMIAEAGHSIQLHSWRHGNLTHFSRSQFIADANRTQEALEEIVGRRADCLRPPYGAVNDDLTEWAAELGLRMVLWDTAGADWLDLTAEQIARRVVNTVRPGSVVLLHDGGGPRERTVSALEVILPELAEKGYRFGAMCSTLPVVDPARVCRAFYAWPKVRPCSEDSRATGPEET